ncbi:MAG: Cyclopropane-fatty-acyl-phospholipid synthase, partial [uncultured Nocardioidaceae bacterium]
PSSPARWASTRCCSGVPVASSRRCAGTPGC